MKARIFFQLIGLMIFLSSCEPIQHIRGNFVAHDDLEAIKVGTTTQAQVKDILGPPSHVQLFDGAGWYYLGEQTEETSFFTSEVLKRLVVFITFDPSGIVSKVDIQDTIPDAQFDLIEDKTPTLGRDPSFFKEIFGSIGKYDEGKHRAGFASSH